MSENSDERRQRQMDFILEQQAQFTVDIQLIKETIATQARASAAEFEQVKERLSRAEALTARNADLTVRSADLAARTEQLLYASIEGQDSLRQEVRNLTTVVDRIGDAVTFLLDREAARGNGANGTGG